MTKVKHRLLSALSFLLIMGAGAVLGLVVLLAAEAVRIKYHALYSTPPKHIFHPR